jgi:hypothetical protein
MGSIWWQIPTGIWRRSKLQQHRGKHKEQRVREGLNPRKIPTTAWRIPSEAAVTGSAISTSGAHHKGVPTGELIFFLCLVSKSGDLNHELIPKSVSFTPIPSVSNIFGVL